MKSPGASSGAAEMVHNLTTLAQNVHPEPGSPPGKMVPLYPEAFGIWLRESAFWDVWLFHTCENIVSFLENEILLEVSGVRGSFKTWMASHCLRRLHHRRPLPPDLSRIMRLSGCGPVNGTLSALLFRAIILKICTVHRPSFMDSEMHLSVHLVSSLYFIFHLVAVWLKKQKPARTLHFYAPAFLRLSGTQRQEAG